MANSKAQLSKALADSKLQVRTLQSRLYIASDTARNLYDDVQALKRELAEAYELAARRELVDSLEREHRFTQEVDPV